MRRMMRWMSVLAVLAASACGLRAQELAGNWQGKLEAGPGLRTVLKITKGADGKLAGNLYSIDQGPGALALTTVSLSGTAVNFTIKPLDITYVGTMNPDGNSITGSGTQGGQTHALNLTRVSEENMWPIPEAPKPMAADAKPKFDVVTVKPAVPNAPGKNIGFRGRHFLGRNFNVDDLIGLAYGMHTKQIIGAPDWFNTELFDIDGIPDVEGQPSMKQMDLLMQDLLTERFKLKFHHEKRELSVYAIRVAKSGPKLTKSDAKPDEGSGFGFRRLGDLTVRNMSMTEFGTWMQASVMDRPVIDETELKDKYDFTLKWTPDDSQFAQFRSTGTAPTKTDDPNAPPSLYTAVQEQLGLRLEPVKAQDDVIVIDHVEHPSAN